MEQILTVETDGICQRNAFYVLSEIDSEKALIYFNDNYEKIADGDYSFQLSILDFLQKRMESNINSNIHDFLKPKTLILDIFNKTKNNIVRFEAANVLVKLNDCDHTIVKSIVKSLIEMSIRESDATLKIFILSRLREFLFGAHASILSDSILDLLQIFNSTDYNVKKTALEILLNSSNNRNVLELIKFLGNELLKASNHDLEYKKMILSIIEALTIRHSRQIASQSVDILFKILKAENDACILKSITSFFK